MSIYVIGDLHLSFNEHKPMDIFGDNWVNHEEKIRTNWIKTVKEDDLVVLLGDFSWAMHLNDTYKDFEYLNSLPGKKVLIKGNHDYWWTTLKSMQEYIQKNSFNNIDFIINNSYNYKNKVIVGTRGWAFTETDNSEKMINRELLRLENSIKHAIDNYGKDNELICVMHYPPINKAMFYNNEKSMFIELMKKYSIKKCFYGHLHGKSHSEAVEGNIDGVELKLVSCDYINFEPYLVEI